MTKLSFLLFLLFSSSWAFAQVSSEVRLSYRKATQSKEGAFAFYEMVKDHKNSDAPVLAAYKGAGLMLLARYEPLTQRAAKVKEAVEWIENALKKDPDDIEIRLIRLSVQEHLPKMLGYHKNREEDRDFIKKSYPTLQDKELKQMIDGYFAEFSKKS
jgi:hypothetical protein